MQNSLGLRAHAYVAHAFESQDPFPLGCGLGTGLARFRNPGGECKLVNLLCWGRLKAPSISVAPYTNGHVYQRRNQESSQFTLLPDPRTFFFIFPEERWYYIVFQGLGELQYDAEGAASKTAMNVHLLCGLGQLFS